MKKKPQPHDLQQLVWRPSQPFNDLPRLPPPFDLETKAILKRCIPARAVLAELKQAAEWIPNHGMLVNTMSLLEAQASSEIENIVTTSDRLFQFRHDSYMVKCNLIL